MAKDLTAEDIARETYLFKYNMESGVILQILLFPLFLVLWLLGNSSTQYTGKWAPDYSKVRETEEIAERMKRL